jgi:lysozyme family protein
MNDDFDTAFSFTTRPDIEGGLVDDPNDSGGITNLGLTVFDLTLWERHQATPDDVRALTLGSARPIYRALYWNVVQGSSLPTGVSLMVFDHGVNRGVGTSAKLLQRLLGFTGDDVDGFIGDKTIGATRVAAGTSSDGAIALIEKIHDAQIADYDALRNARYVHGWEGRTDKRRAAAILAAQSIAA